MTITTLVGRQNEGKTMGGIRLIIPDYLMGRTIYTNTWLAIPHILINKDFLLDIVEKGISIRNATYFLDEFWMWADARKRDTLLSYMYMQSSKDNANLVITTQTDRQIDVRLREAMHFYGECERKILYRNRLIPIPKKYRHMRKELPEWIQNILFIQLRLYNPTSSILRKNIYSSDFELYKTLRIYAKYYYKFYDTTKKIKLRL